MKTQTQYHTQPISAVANTLAAVLQIRDVAGTDEIEALVRYAYDGEAEHVLLFCPSAVGSEVLLHYHTEADSIKALAPLAEDFVVPYPADPVTSYASMMAGVTVDKSNRQDYEREFDADGEPPRSLLTECKGKRRAAIFATDKHPCRNLWQNTGAEIYTARTDMDVVTKAVEYIRKDCYDLIIVLVNEFDQMSQATKIYGKRADTAIANHVTEFTLLADAASVYMRGNTFVGFCPDHGCHKDLLGAAAHRSHRPDDLNVTHYYGVISSLKQQY